MTAIRLLCSILATALALTACGGAATGDGNGGDGDGGYPTPYVFVSATVGPGPESPPGVCTIRSTEPFLLVGSPSPGTPTTIAAGQSQGGQIVSFNCAVSPAGSGFIVEGGVSLEDNSELSISTPGVPPGGRGAVTQAGGQPIHVEWRNPAIGAAVEDDCTITFTYVGAPIATDEALSPGHIWGHVSCPHAEFYGAPPLPPSASSYVECDGEADFLFDDCAR